MDVEKPAPWNWFKKEEESKGEVVPVKRDSEPPVSRREVQSEIERLFDSLRQGLHLGWPSSSFIKKEWLKPSLDIASDAKAYSVKVELPGIDADNIASRYKDGVLSISILKKMLPKAPTKQIKIKTES
ncbi:MAG: Hsp20 family protein [Campylobacterales bacterium]|nr:Hsp20 family protein [Campylobacterales bacterium]